MIQEEEKIHGTRRRKSSDLRANRKIEKEHM
jgi:hypothetical protein